MFCKSIVGGGAETLKVRSLSTAEAKPILNSRFLAIAS